MLKHAGLAKSLGNAPDSNSGGALPLAGSSPAPGTHYCKKCEKHKPITEFSVKSRHDPTPRSECGSCSSLRMKEWRKQNRERDKETQRRSQARKRERRKQAGGSRGLKADGPFDPNAHERIDGGPFQAWVDGQLAKGRSYEVLALGSGVSPRSLRRTHQEQRNVSLSVVDRVLMANGAMLWELYD